MINLGTISIGVLLLVVATESQNIDLRKVDSKVLTALESSGRVNVSVSFKQETSSILNSISKSYFASRAEKLSSLRSALLKNAEQSQTSIIGFLRKQLSPDHYTSIWITNQLYLKNIDFSLVSTLSQFQGVKDIKLEKVFVVDNPVVHGDVTSRRQSQTEWNIEKVGATAAQEYLKNVTSTPFNVTVATISGGVLGTHEAFKDNFVQDYGWFDTIYLSDTPNDDIFGVGTHNLGTILGKGGIGVYPDAKWIACKACDEMGCFMNAIIQCSQYVMCPTRPDGSDPNCDLAPVVVHGNWLGGEGDTDLDETIMALNAAGISVVLPIGGSGPECRTARSPGDTQMPVFSVGGTTANDSSYSRSSNGPSVWGKLKPELTAPGELIRSASSAGDDSYGLLSGTSMASPHVAGVIALLKAYNESLTFTDLERIISTGGVETDSLLLDDRDCGQLIPGQAFPNNIFGWGRINALLALQTASETKY